MTVETHLVEQPKPLHLVGSLLPFPDAALEKGHLVNLPIVLAGLLLEEVLTQSLCFEVAGNAEGVRMMGLFQSVPNARVLRQVAVGVPDFEFRTLCLQAIEERPPHNSHEGGVSEGLSTLLLENDLSCVVRLMARLAKRDQVVRRVPTRFTAFEVVDVENRIFGFAVAVAAFMAVAEKDVFSDVPEAEPVALLVLRAFNVRVLDLLDVEGRRFHDDLRHRKNLPDSRYTRQVGVYFVLNARSELAFVLGMDTVIESGSAVARLAVAASTTQLPTRRQ